MNNQQWGGQGQGGGYGGQAQARPGVFVPHQNSNSNGAQPMGLGGVMNDPFLGSMAGNLLQQQGQSYYTYMQSKVGGVLSGGGGTMAYLFSVTPEYVFQKISMLLVPFLRTWTYVRQPDPGPHKWEPAATDTNAPDLYIGVTALWTYCLLVGVSVFKSEAFSPEVIISTVSSSVGAWLFHTVVLKGILWSLGVGGVGLLELSSYAGYSFVYGCFILLGRLASSTLGHAIWAYSGFAYALFLVRTVKSIVRADPKYHYGTYWTKEGAGRGRRRRRPRLLLARLVRPSAVSHSCRPRASLVRQVGRRPRTTCCWASPCSSSSSSGTTAGFLHRSNATFCQTACRCPSLAGLCLAATGAAALPFSVRRRRPPGGGLPQTTPGGSSWRRGRR